MLTLCLCHVSITFLMLTSCLHVNNILGLLALCPHYVSIITLHLTKCEHAASYILLLMSLCRCTAKPLWMLRQQQSPSSSATWPTRGSGGLRASRGGAERRRHRFTEHAVTSAMTGRCFCSGARGTFCTTSSPRIYEGGSSAYLLF